MLLLLSPWRTQVVLRRKSGKHATNPVFPRLVCMGDPPRNYLPGAYYHVTRKCEAGQFFLHPDMPEVAQGVEYCLAKALDAHDGVEVLSYNFLSNHYHGVYYDRDGRMGDFLRDLHSSIAQVVNKIRGRENGRVWERKRPRVVALKSTETVLSDICYDMGNATIHYILPRAAQWWGAMSRPEDVLAPPKEIPRPSVLSDSEPEFRLLKTREPPFWAEGDGEYLQDLVGRLQNLEGERARSLRNKRRREKAETGRAVSGWVGVDGIKRKNWHHKAAGNSDEQRGRHPHIAAAEPEIFEAALEEWRETQAEHRECAQKFRAGDRGVLFPPGSWWYSRIMGALTRAPPDPGSTWVLCK